MARQEHRTTAVDVRQFLHSCIFAAVVDLRCQLTVAATGQEMTVQCCAHTDSSLPAIEY